MPKNKNKNLALFDIAPVNKLHGYALGSYPVYRTYENGRQFLNDIYEVTNELQVNILFKTKRNFGEIHDKKYINFFDEFCKRRFVHKIPHDVSPVNLAQYADMSISIPFTSTAFMMGDIPSIFYDPTSKLLRNDPGAQGKILISSKKELRKWLINCCND
jgi:polysaccharide biosynthesis PFTS motif protein